MAYRVIMIENEVSIKVKLNNLIISKGLEKDVDSIGRYFGNCYG